MPRHPITIEDLWEIPRVGSPVPAPDGSFLVVPVTTHSMETNEATCRLWLVPGGGGSPRALTTTEASSGQPAISADGTRLAFVRKPGSAKKAVEKPKIGPRHPDAAQLYVMPLDGGEAERLTDLPLGVADPRWFPDGRRIAFLAEVFGAAPTVEGTAEHARALEAEPVKAAVTEERIYRFWDHWLTQGKVHHIFVLDVATRALLDLTPGSERWFPLDDPSDSYRIAPDGREIAFTATRSLPPHDPLIEGVFTVSVPERIEPGADGKPVTQGRTGAVDAGSQDPRLLTAGQPAHAFRPVYSPDGRFIVYGMQREIDFYGDRVRLAACERASGRHVVLTESWDRSAAGWTFAAGPANRIYLEAETEGRTGLFDLDLDAALRDPASAVPRELVRGGAFTPPQPAGGRIFTTRQSLREPPEVVSYDRDGADARVVTRMTAPSMEQLALGEVEEIVFAGAGGRPVQMFLVHPPATAPGPAPGASAQDVRAQDGSRQGLPLVHVIHGGPHGASGDQWHWRWNAQAFAAPGYIVAMVNFHGSTGWGQEFTASILGRWGAQPYQDVMAATDLLVARGLVDPGRMAATGGSYGGYLAAWIASQTERFACIVNHAGVCDFQTQLGSDITQGWRRAMGGAPWDEIEAMDRYNPMRLARGFKTPMLVIHGEKDYRVPFNQALTIYNTHKAMGIPARLVCYPDENHWILKPRNSRHWYGEVLGWLDRWLGKARK